MSFFSLLFFHFSRALAKKQCVRSTLCLCVRLFSHEAQRFGYDSVASKIRRIFREGIICW